MKNLLSITAFILLIGGISAQKKGEREVIKMSASISESPTFISLSWNKIATVSNYRIYKSRNLFRAPC